MGEKPVDDPGRKLRGENREMGGTVDGPQFDCAAGRVVRIARDDCVQPWQRQIDIQGRTGIGDRVAGTVIPGPQLDRLQSAGKRRNIPRRSEQRNPVRSGLASLRDLTLLFSLMNFSWCIDAHSIKPG